MIVIFSKDNVNTLIKFTERLVPSVGGLLHAWIDRQKLSFQGQHVPETGVCTASSFYSLFTEGIGECGISSLEWYFGAYARLLCAHNAGSPCQHGIRK